MQKYGEHKKKFETQTQKGFSSKEKEFEKRVRHCMQISFVSRDQE